MSRAPHLAAVPFSSSRREFQIWPSTSFAARQQYIRNRGQSGSGWRALKTSLMTPQRKSLGRGCSAERTEVLAFLTSCSS